MRTAVTRFEARIASTSKSWGAAAAVSGRTSAHVRCSARNRMQVNASWRLRSRHPVRHSEGRSYQQGSCDLDGGTTSVVWPPALIYSWFRNPPEIDAIHLHDERPREGSSSRRRCAQGHLALVPAWRQDRRARPERRRQELASQDHVGEDREFIGEAFPARHVGRVPPAGASPRPIEDSPRERRGRRGGHQGAARTIRRAQHEARRRPVPRGDGQSHGRAGPPSGPHRCRECLGRGLAARTGHGCLALPVTRRGRHDAVRRRTSPRRAVPVAAQVPRSPPAGRADQPVGRGVSRLA